MNARAQLTTLGSEFEMGELDQGASNRKRMMEAIVSVRSFDDVNKLVFDQGLKELGFTTRDVDHRIGGNGLEVVLVAPRDPEAYVRRFELINGLRMSSAPKYFDPLITLDGYCVIAYEWPGAQYMEPLPYDPTTAPIEKRTKLFSELSRVADAGLEHPLRYRRLRSLAVKSGHSGHTPH